MEHDPLRRLALCALVFSAAAAAALVRPSVAPAAVAVMVLCQFVGLASLYALARERDLVHVDEVCLECYGEGCASCDDWDDVGDGWDEEDAQWLAAGWPVPRGDRAPRHASWLARRRLVRDVEQFLRDVSGDHGDAGR